MVREDSRDVTSRKRARSPAGDAADGGNRRAAVPLPRFNKISKKDKNDFLRPISKPVSRLSPLVPLLTANTNNCACTTEIPPDIFASPRLRALDEHFTCAPAPSVARASVLKRCGNDPHRSPQEARFSPILRPANTLTIPFGTLKTSAEDNKEERKTRQKSALTSPSCTNDDDVWESLKKNSCSKTAYAEGSTSQQNEVILGSMSPWVINIDFQGKGTPSHIGKASTDGPGKSKPASIEQITPEFEITQYEPTSALVAESMDVDKLASSPRTSQPTLDLRDTGALPLFTDLLAQHQRLTAQRNALQTRREALRSRAQEFAQDHELDQERRKLWDAVQLLEGDIEKEEAEICAKEVEDRRWEGAVRMGREAVNEARKSFGVAQIN